MIQPTLFGDDINNFPITWHDVETFTYEELQLVHPDSFDLEIENNKGELAYCSSKYTTYSVTREEADIFVELRKIVQNLLTTWDQTMKFGFGILGNVYIDNIRWRFYQQEEEGCLYQIITYPAQL